VITPFELTSQRIPSIFLLTCLPASHLTAASAQKKRGNADIRAGASCGAGRPIFKITDDFGIARG